MPTPMTRREFLGRSAPLLAAGLVTPWFVEAIARRLFGPKRYWDMGAARQKAVDCLGMDWATGPDVTAVVVSEPKSRGLWKMEMDFRVIEVSLVEKPLPGHVFQIIKAAEDELSMAKMKNQEV